jgi:hypothetical protein
MVGGLLCGALAACSPSYPTPADIREQPNPTQPQGDVVLRTSKYDFVTMGRRIGPAIDDGFRPGEEIILGTPSIYDGVRTVKHAGRIEEIGAKYDFFHDGSGGVDFGDGTLRGWHTGCKTDKITDKRRCSLTSYEADITVIYTGSGKPRYACAVGHDFPGRVGAFRVDQNKPIKTNVEGCISGSNLHRFLAQMRNGSTTVARTVHWPYDYNRDTTADDTPLFRYAEELLRFNIVNISRLSFSPADATVEELE